MKERPSRSVLEEYEKHGISAGDAGEVARHAAEIRSKEETRIKEAQKRALEATAIGTICMAAGVAASYHHNRHSKAA